MRRFAAIIVLIGIFLTGCASEKDTLSPAIEFRAAAARAGCRFHTAVQADLGETAVQFAMDCDAGPDGAVALTVTEPETLSGITARAAAESGQLTFEGLALDFGLLANGNVVPAAAPAIVVDCWLRQYISSAGQEEERYRVTYERDFDEKKLFVDTWFENAVPICAEVCYNGQRILKLQITDFTLK